MARISSRAANLAVVVCAVVTMVLAEYSTATSFQVGGPVGWSLAPLKGDPNFYQNWAHSHFPYHTGDIIEFRWSPGDSVAQVNYAEFVSCDAGLPQSFWDWQGSVAFNLVPYRFSTVYFISGAPGHCDAGQKFFVDVFD